MLTRRVSSRQLFNWINSSRTCYPRALFFLTDHILSCNANILGECTGDNQFCNGTANECQCKNGFTWVGENCEEPDSDSSGPHNAAAAVIAIFTIALVICGLYLVIRKYNLVEYARQKINARRNNDVMYEDVMIGQDDPPLSPWSSLASSYKHLFICVVKYLKSVLFYAFHVKCCYFSGIWLDAVNYYGYLALLLWLASCNGT